MHACMHALLNYVPASAILKERRLAFRRNAMIRDILLKITRIARIDAFYAKTAKSGQEHAVLFQSFSSGSCNFQWIGFPFPVKKT